MVHIDFQHSRNCIRQYRFFSRMAYDLAPQCNFLYRFLQCKLPENTIDVEIMVRMMKGIHTFKKDCYNQTSSSSRWGLQVHPFPSLEKKMVIYLEERRNIADPLCLTCNCPNRHTRSPFSEAQTPKKKKRKKTGEAKKRCRKVNCQANKNN